MLGKHSNPQVAVREVGQVKSQEVWEDHRHLQSQQIQGRRDTCGTVVMATGAQCLLLLDLIRWTGKSQKIQNQTEQRPAAEAEHTWLSDFTSLSLNPFICKS